MKLGVAGRISVTDIDLADTVDLRPKYADCVVLFDSADESCNNLGQEWLNAISEEALAMTGYPPKCTQNANRHFIGAEHEMRMWPGDTIEYVSGDIWRMNADGVTFTMVRRATANLRCA